MCLWHISNCSVRKLLSSDYSIAQPLAGIPEGELPDSPAVINTLLGNVSGKDGKGRYIRKSHLNLSSQQVYLHESSSVKTQNEDGGVL